MNLRFGGSEDRAASDGFGRGSGGGGSGGSHFRVPRVLRDKRRNRVMYFFVPEAREEDWTETDFPCSFVDWERMVEAVRQNWTQVLGSKRQLDHVRADTIPDQTFSTLKPHFESVYGRKTDELLNRVVPQTKKDLLEVTHSTCDL